MEFKTATTMPWQPCYDSLAEFLPVVSPSSIGGAEADKRTWTWEFGKQSGAKMIVPANLMMDTEVVTMESSKAELMLNMEP